MSDAFISYRRKPSAALANLIERELQSKHHIDAYMDTTRTDSSRVQFPERLMKAIEAAPTFICLLGDSTLDSEWVRKEIQRAYELRKHCIPVFQESYVPPTSMDDALDYLLNFDGVHVLDVKSIFLNESINKVAALVVRQPTGRTRWLGIAAALLFILIAIMAGFFLLNNGEEDKQSPTPTSLAQQAMETPDTDETTRANETAVAAASSTLATPTPLVAFSVHLFKRDATAEAYVGSLTPLILLVQGQPANAQGKVTLEVIQGSGGILAMETLPGSDAILPRSHEVTLDANGIGQAAFYARDQISDVIITVNVYDTTNTIPVEIDRLEFTTRQDVLTLKVALDNVAEINRVGRSARLP